ncbi:MAG TPA: protein kinase, partial [Gemmatimonadales bacterium]
LARERRLLPEEAIRLAREVADALDYAHRHGILHRDIKPENIMLAEGHALVTDFGIARALGEAGAERLTQTGVSPGTPQYMSPEQVQGDPQLDGRSDLYSLACVLYEMLSGVPPFAGGSVESVLAKRLTGAPPPVRTQGVGVSPTIEAALHRALAPARENRFATAGEFSTALAGTGEVVVVPRGPRRVVALLGLIALLVSGGLVTTTLIRRGGRQPINSLAILPLTSADSATRYLSEGIHEAVADLLRRLPQLRVTAPSLVRQMQRQRPDATTLELGQELDVGAVLTWDLRPGQDSLHLRAELLQIPGGSLLWSARYDRPSRDILAIQNDIARTITESLRITLRGEDEVTLARQPTRDPVAYDLYLRGRHHIVQAAPFRATFARENNDSVLYYANQVIARDPGFAGAYFLRAGYYLTAAIRAWRQPLAVVLDSAWGELQRATERDSTLAEVWVNRGSMTMFFKDDWPLARRELQTGVRLDPDLAYARQYYGIYLGELERALDSAIAHLRHAVALEPSALYYNTLGDLLMRARRYDPAIAALREAVRLDPGLPGPWTRLIQIYERTRRWSDAIDARRRAPDSTGAETFARAFAAEGEAGYGRVLGAEIRRRIDSLLGAPRNEVADTFPPLREGRIALLYAQLGEWTTAMDWVLREYQRRPKRFRWFVAHPDMDGLRNDPRFLPLVRREGLEELLRP